MKQYQVTYNDNTIDIVEAYSYTMLHGRVVFDKGHHNVCVLFDVKRVDLVGE